MTNKTKWLIYAIGGSAMVLLFFFFVFRGTDEYKVKLPVMSYVKPFSFINQDSATVTLDQVKGKIYVANYFFVNCRGICPDMNGNLHTVYEKFKGNPQVAFLTHTCEPENDSVPALKEYARLMDADGKQWQFLTGDKLALYQAARESYKIDDPHNNVGDIGDQFLHSQFLSLVDQMGRVRGVYDGLKRKEVSLLISDINMLLAQGQEDGVLDKILSK